MLFRKQISKSLGKSGLPLPILPAPGHLDIRKGHFVWYIVVPLFGLIFLMLFNFWWEQKNKEKNLDNCFIISENDNLIGPLAITRDGKTLIAGTHLDGQLFFYDMKTLEKKKSIDDRNSEILFSITLSNDDSLLAPTGSDKINIWDLTGPKEKKVASLDCQYWIHSSCFSFDNKVLLTCGGGPEKNEWEMILWDTKTWQVIKRYSGQGKMISARFIKKGKKIITKLDCGPTEIWDLDNNKKETIEISFFSSPHFGYIPSEEVLVFGDYSYNKKIITKKDYYLVNYWHEEKKREKIIDLGNEPIMALAINKSEEKIAFAQGYANEGEKTIRIFDRKKGVKEFSRKMDIKVLSLCFSPDDKHLIVGGGRGIDGKILIFNLEGGKEDRPNAPKP